MLKSSRTPKLNLRLKTHKEHLEYRPIVDFRYTCLYGFEKFIKEKLNEIPNSLCSLKNTEDLILKLKSNDIKSNYQLGSLDIINLYPSIPLELIVDTLKSYNVHNWLINAIQFCFYNNFIDVNGKYYRQKDGVIMGSVIGPKLAELVLIELDKYLLKCRGMKFIGRFVDDVLCVFDENLITLEEIKNYANLFNKSLQFTIEKEINGSLNYLDITIFRKNNSFQFKRYWKKLNNFKMLNFYSNTPLHIKRNLFISEIKKTYNRTTLKIHQVEEIKQIYKMFLLNDYPKRILKKWEQDCKKIDYKNSNLIKNNLKVNNKRKDNIYFSVPYEKDNFYAVRDIFKSIDINIAPKLHFTIKNLIYLGRTVQSILSMDHVVYKLECTCTNKHIYIGETKRQLQIRVNEHDRYIRSKTGKSGISLHCLQNNCSINKNSIQILKQERKHTKRFFYEFYFIKKEEIKNNNLIVNNKNGLKIPNIWWEILFPVEGDINV